jgi:hypothetical protein
LYGAGYNPEVDPSVDNFFCAAALRYGHSEANSVIPLLDENFQEAGFGSLLLREVF